MDCKRQNIFRKKMERQSGNGKRWWLLATPKRQGRQGEGKRDNETCLFVVMCKEMGEGRDDLKMIVCVCVFFVCVCVFLCVSGSKNVCCN